MISKSLYIRKQKHVARMEKRGLLVIAVLLFSAFFVMGACPHGVTICGIPYNCGVSDNVCPETFGANCRDTVNVSCYYSDPDCGATCLTAGAGAIGNADCLAKDVTKPICCGSPGSGTCAACCPGIICNAVRAPAAAPGALYNSGGDYSCQGNCTAIAPFTCNVAGNCNNCNLNDSYYNTSTTRQIDSTANFCEWQNQVWQEYRNYYASGTTCAYTPPTVFRWWNTTRVNKADNTVCASESGGCEANDVCISGSCQERYASSTTVCRAANHICDVAENCTGSSATCPANSTALNTVQCNSNFACSSAAGDNNYNAGGTYRCQGYCDGFGSCDYAGSCTNCGSSSCTDYDIGNNPFARTNITLSGGCFAGACITSVGVWDSCYGTQTNDTTCNGVNQGPGVFYQCNLNDTSNCWCNVASSNLNQVCDDWSCTNGRCQDSGSDLTSNTWVCSGALPQGTSQNCPTSGGAPTAYRCFITNAGSWSWTSGAMPAEGVPGCLDGYNNDWDANSYWDYDTGFRGGAGSSPHGDTNCRVGITIPAQVPASVAPGQLFRVNATSTVASVNSFNAKIDETGVECNFIMPWIGSVGNFECTAPATPGSYTVKFYINASKSYQTGSNLTRSFTVAATACTGLPQASCTGACEWCVDCIGRLANGNPATSQCVDAGNCNRICVAGQCIADTCDLSTGCASTCTGDVRNVMVCDGTCTCQLDFPDNCNLRDCTTNAGCTGAGTPTLSLGGDNYVCSPGADCQISGTTTCETRTCAAIGQLWVCNGDDYYCVWNGTDIVWNETMPTTETYCDDTLDNDGDTLVDCADPDCPPDNVPYCCNAARYTDTTTSPADDGMGFGLDLFDAPPPGIGNNGIQSCCGNNPDEWYWNNGGTGGCCDQSSDCIDQTGACFNNNTPVVEAHQQHCINHAWYPCNETNHINGEIRGTYTCTNDPSTTGWGWRSVFPLENCTDGIDNNLNSLTDCGDAECMGNCSVGCGVPEDTIVPGTCTDGIDNDCDSLIDGNDGANCTEGSSNTTTNPERKCWDGISNEVAPQTDAPDLPLADFNDDGCCDLCTGMGPFGSLMYFDTASGARTNCGVPGCNCGILTFTDWDTGTTPYCCGDEPGEFYKINPSNPSLIGCCNSSAGCIDDTGECQSGIEETEALCMDGIDNDCDGLIDCQDTNCTGIIYGIVRDDTNKLLGGATIKSSPPGKLEECERSTTSLIDGSYTLDALIGSYNIIARKPGYDDNVTWVTILSKQAEPTGHQVNFNLRNGTCHADCTDSYGNCNPDCDGLGFANGTGIDYCSLVSVCANRPKGFRATQVSGSTVTEYSCCEGETIRTYPVKKARVGGELENLYVYKTVVKLGLKYVTLNIAYGYPIR